MKLTQVLCRQHLGRMIKFNWFAHTKQTPIETHAEWYLGKHGINVVDPIDVVNPRKPKIDITPFSQYAIPIGLPQKTEKHPDYKERACLRVLDDELLVEGLQQAQKLTKTLIISENSLPDKIENSMDNLSRNVDKTIQKMIQTSNIFDAQQVKLPKRKDPERPAWVFPRDYGINAVRKSRNLTIKFLHLCESLCGPQIAQQRQIIHDGSIKVPLFKDGDLLKLEMTLDFLITSTKLIKPMDSRIDAAGKTLPALLPLLPTAGLRKDHFYDLKTIYPVSEQSPWSNPQTIFIYHDVEKVKNMTELPVREEQLLARSLMKSFATAASYAKKTYGDEIDELPEPITIQCVQTDSQNFHFSILQLNSLNLDDNEEKCNYWWSTPQIPLFTKAKYENGMPVFEGYNPEVFRRILAFYKNV